MPAPVRIPPPLRTATGGESTVTVDGTTVAEVVAALAATHPAIGERILDDDGRLRRFVNVFVDEEDIRFNGGMDAPVPDGATVSIVPAVAGGAG